MIRQFNEIKEQNRDKILLFRVGDFYEMFFDDAKTGAKELEITLTARDTVPLAGFPYHALNNYLGRLIERGYKVAICEQVEDPKLAKGIVKREIVRVITPGSVIESCLLDEKSNNYLAAVYAGKGGYGLAAVDVSTGDFVVTQGKGKQAEKMLSDELTRLQPVEVLINESARDDAVILRTIARMDRQPSVNVLPDKHFTFRQAENTLLSQFSLASLDGLGCSDLTLGVPAAGAAIRYLRDNSQNDLQHIHKPAVYFPEGYMLLDGATRRNLELTRTIRDEKKYGSLLWVLDKTQTAMGARLLKRWIEQPLLDGEAVNRRLDTVAELFNSVVLGDELSELLDQVYDLERLMGRVHCESANARDLVALRKTLSMLPQIRSLLEAKSGSSLGKLAQGLPDLSELTIYLSKALADDPPLTIKDGGLLRDGFHGEVDQLRYTCRHGKDYILELERKERERTGIKSLKIGFNKVFGYYIEVTRTNQHLVPADFVRKQTLANAERFITPELKEYESQILGAEEKICALEYDVFLEVREHVARHTVLIQEAAATLAALDVFQSLAKVARDNRYVRPRVEDNCGIEIRDGRHAVVERVLRNELFVPNDVSLDRESQRILMITGPNMAGKSTYMRQVALIVLMAQIGSFVPAGEARIGVVDRIFTRIGAADDLVGGQSTFMIEMSEVAGILNGATEKSLVLLDEVGRGTSTFDGISIARSVVEHLYDRVGALTMFATHYHELTDMASRYHAVMNLATAVKERGEDIVFLHKVIPGSVDHSYGIQVARLAGLPRRVIERSREILATLEAPGGSVREVAATMADEQMQLFVPSAELLQILDQMEAVDMMTTTPLEAMQLLYKLQQALKEGK
jgi:DNA mismatch repair protein MutS